MVISFSVQGDNSKRENSLFLELKNVYYFSPELNFTSLFQRIAPVNLFVREKIFFHKDEKIMSII